MRKRMLIIICLVHLFGRLTAQQVIALIPQPVSLETRSGYFQLPDKLTIFLNTDKSEVHDISKSFAKRLVQSTGKSFPISRSNPGSSPGLLLRINNTADTLLKQEGYRLTVTKSQITIIANGPAGLFYGFQTLLQLMPPEIEKNAVTKEQWKVPCLSIVDYPRFQWRGILLDVVRHYFDKKQVKAFIDDMVKYKFNVLHLHLTDDQGWRIEIKSLPKLTEVGAWRAERTGRWGEFSKPKADEPKTYGGYFSHNDIRELVKYAQERFVTILPEIDIPGHSMAAVASYPELSCTPGEYYVSAGDRFMFWKGNSFYSTIDNTLCPANENVYRFLDSIFTEVAQLFPSAYIHVGGDECYKGFWEKSEACQKLMENEGLKTTEELQSYFIKRVQKIIESKGKKMIGWDEIMEGGLAPGAVVMSWRGMSGGIEAAKMNHKVIMTPNDFAYVDLYQGDPAAEPLTYSMLRLKKAYQFDPVPPGISEDYILGGQCNLWTERVPNFRHAQYMLWPRALATAESLWSPTGQKDWNRFVQKVERHFTRFDFADVKYSRSMYDPILTAENAEDGTLRATMTTEIDGLKIFYSFDETNPDRFYPLYQGPLTIPGEASNLKFVTYHDNKQIGKIISVSVEDLKKRAGIKAK